MLSRQDGTLTADPGQIHALVEKVWVKGGVQQERLHETEGGLGNFHGGLQEDDWRKEGGHAGGLENL